jgi:peptidoglycan/xylan/chitin deacetylase (PgdA/CDA1 family)
MRIFNNINILLYHQIGDTPQKDTNLDCFCNSTQFYRQMEFLNNSNFKVISLSKASEIISNKLMIDNNYVVLTFDDGCEKFYDITYPILEKFNFPSSIYPVAGYIGKDANWGKKKYPGLKILSKSMLNDLSKSNVEIGAHTMDHLKLTQVDERTASLQISESKTLLEQILGKRINSFSYPHGAFNKNIIQLVKDAGFENAMTCIPKFAQDCKSIYEIPRKYITYFDTLESFNLKLNNSQNEPLPNF